MSGNEEKSNLLSPSNLGFMLGALLAAATFVFIFTLAFWAANLDDKEKMEKENVQQQHKKCTK